MGSFQRCSLCDNASDTSTPLPKTGSWHQPSCTREDIPAEATDNLGKDHHLKLHRSCALLFQSCEKDEGFEGEILIVTARQ